MWTYKDIARFTGLKVQSLKNLVGKGQMPPPDDRLGYHVPVWAEETIRRWWDARNGSR